MKENFFDHIPANNPDEIIQILQADANVRIERILSYGQASPENFWYEQDENEWVILLAGSAELEFEAEDIVKLKQGDYIYIPAFKKHRVKSTSQTETTIWLAFFFAQTDKD